MKPPYFLLEDGLPTGPHSLVVLHQKADIRVIGPQSSVRPAASSDAPWLPIRAIPDLHALLFPAKVAPTLSTSTRFISVNSPAPANASTAVAERPVVIERMLQDNTARLVASEHFNPSAVTNRRAARRFRSYILTVLACAAPAVALYRYGPFPQTESTLICLAGFVGVAALMSYWMIYHISDFRS